MGGNNGKTNEFRDTLADFRGKLSRRHVSDPWAYTRAQYARLLMNPDEIVKNFATV